jgi:flagellar hook-basal body complex protein FliE
MIPKINSQANIDSMLAAMRQYQVDAAGKNTQPVLAPPTPEIGKPTFGDAIKTAVVQTYDRGEDVPLTDVVLAMQKSSLAFEATLQIRNKVLKAYEDILNMPV